MPCDPTNPTACARGSYQRSLLTGAARWSGSDLKGKAHHWSSGYARSRASLLVRLKAAGHAVEVRDYKNDNKRMMRVLFVDGVPMSAQS